MTRHSLITLLRKKIQSITLLRQKRLDFTHYAITHYTFLITPLHKFFGPITHYATKKRLITPLRQPITPPPFKRNFNRFSHGLLIIEFLTIDDGLITTDLYEDTPQMYDDTP